MAAFSMSISASCVADNEALPKRMLVAMSTSSSEKPSREAGFIARPSVRRCKSPMATEPVRPEASRDVKVPRAIQPHAGRLMRDRWDRRL